MPTTMRKVIQAKEQSRLKRLLVVLSSAAVPEPTPSKFTQSDKPKYLRYIDYV